MQSGISVSQDLRKAFQTLRNTPSQRGLVATIVDHHVILSEVIPSTSSFIEDAKTLAQYCRPYETLYMLVRKSIPSTTASSIHEQHFVAITYVPDLAPVRQKTLSASTRLSLVRELGVHYFTQSMLFTTAEELSSYVWEEEEESCRGSEEMVDNGGRRNKGTEDTDGKGLRLNRPVNIMGGFSQKVEDGVVDALKGLKGGKGDGHAVILKFDNSTEIIMLDCSVAVTLSTIASHISSTEPRYTFFRHTFSDVSSAAVHFIYSCPMNSKFKERMLYAVSRLNLLALAEGDCGMNITKKFEVSDPSEIVDVLTETNAPPSDAAKLSFSKPKRPGR